MSNNIVNYVTFRHFFNFLIPTSICPHTNTNNLIYTSLLSNQTIRSSQPLPVHTKETTHRLDLQHPLAVFRPQIHSQSSLLPQRHILSLSSLRQLLMYQQSVFVLVQDISHENIDLFVRPVHQHVLHDQQIRKIFYF